MSSAPGRSRGRGSREPGKPTPGDAQEAWKVTAAGGRGERPRQAVWSSGKQEGLCRGLEATAQK